MCHKFVLRFCVTLIGLLAVGCGDSSNDCDKKTAAEYKESKDCTDSPKVEKEPEVPTAFYVRGSVVGAFKVEVDGDAYDDIEAFYTAESARLNEKVTAAGYEGYAASFQAAIGFKDLTRGMAVFVAPIENRGYSARTSLADNETFNVRFPPEAAGDVYQVKAVKKVSIVLTKEGADPVLLCYNFAAVATEVDYEKVDKPVALSSFETSLTAYECSDEESGSFQIPGIL